jgi:hypothetical protein
MKYVLLMQFAIKGWEWTAQAFAAHPFRQSGGDLDGAFGAVHVDDPEPSEKLLGLGERPVRHRRRADRPSPHDLDPFCASRTGAEAREHPHRGAARNGRP